MFLCPHIPMESILKRTEVLGKQLRRHVITDTVPMVPVMQPYKCPVCQNTDESYMIQDDSQGTLICLGSDGLGCGGVIQENRWLQPDMYTVSSPEERYSPQAMFTSNTINDTKYQRLNNMVEKNLSRYLKDDMVTGDHYKDNQRREAYRILDMVGQACLVDPEVIRSVKIMFHELREKMTRIHKLEMVLCCLICMVMS